MHYIRKRNGLALIKLFMKIVVHFSQVIKRVFQNNHQLQLIFKTGLISFQLKNKTVRQELKNCFPTNDFNI